MWRAADAGSWVTPQLVTVLSLTDVSFMRNALTRLTAMPTQTTRNTGLIHQLNATVLRAPQIRLVNSAKLASSLYFLLRFDHPDDGLVMSLADRADLEQLIEHDDDSSGHIAMSSRERFLELVVPDSE